MSDPHELSLHVFGEHFFGVDGDEGAAAAGEDFVFFVEDFGGVNVGSSADFDLAAFDAERLVQRDRLQIFDGHLASECDDMMELVYFAHGIVEDACDDAAMAVARRSGVTLPEAEVADEGLPLFVEEELKAHAFGIVLAADEAVVLLHLHEASVVAVGLGLRWHGGILTDEGKLFIPARFNRQGAGNQAEEDRRERSPVKERRRAKCSTPPQGRTI